MQIGAKCVIFGSLRGIQPPQETQNMAKIYQVRYTVGDKTVAHEHYTEKGAKIDAKQLSKVIGNAMLGEINHADDGTKTLSRVWEYAGGESGKPIPREGPPTDVEVIRSVEDTKISEEKVEKKPKAPKLTDEEKIAKKKEEAEATLAAITAGTYVLPVIGRKPSADGATRKPKVEVDKVAKLVEMLKVSENTAKIIAATGLNASSRRTKVAIPIFEAGGPIMASEVLRQVNEGAETPFDMKEVMLFALHLNYLFAREHLPWFVTNKAKENDTRLNLIPVPVNIVDDEAPEDQDTTQSDVA